jgi:hypothetical protein
LHQSHSMSDDLGGKAMAVVRGQVVALYRHCCLCAISLPDPVTVTMRQRALLLRCLHRHEALRRSAHCLVKRFDVYRVVLARLMYGLNALIAR